jgi:hypothetical protein
MFFIHLIDVKSEQLAFGCNRASGACGLSTLTVAGEGLTLDHAFITGLARRWGGGFSFGDWGYRVNQRVDSQDEQVSTRISGCNILQFFERA